MANALTFAGALQLNFYRFTTQVKDCDSQAYEINHCAPFCNNKINAAITGENGVYVMEMYINMTCKDLAIDNSSNLMMFPFLCAIEGIIQIDSDGSSIIWHATNGSSSSSSYINSSVTISIVVVIVAIVVAFF